MPCEVMTVENKNGRVVFMPDIEYKAWVNKNKEILAEIVESGRVVTAWLRIGQNKKFLVRYFHERGYTINIE